MTTLRTGGGVAVLRPARGDVVLASRRGPDPATVIPDSTGAVGSMMLACAGKDRRRKEENR